MRATDGSGELTVASYELFSQTEVLGRMAMERMLAGLSTRRYPVGLEPVGQRVEQVAVSGTQSYRERRAANSRLLAMVRELGDMPRLQVATGKRLGEVLQVMGASCMLELGGDVEGEWVAADIGEVLTQQVSSSGRVPDGGCAHDFDVMTFPVQ